MSQADADFTEQTAVEEAVAPASDSNHDNNQNQLAGNPVQGGSGEAEASSVEQRISNVSSPEDFEAMMAEVQQNPQAFENPTDEQIDNQPNGSEQEQSALPEGEEGEEGEQGSSSAEEPEVESESQDQADDVAKDEGKLPQFRLRPQEKVDAEAFRIYKAAEAAQAPISMGDALVLAKRNLGITEKPQTPEDSWQDDAGEQESADDPTDQITLSEAKQELKDLRKKHSQALRDGDLDEAADVMDQISETEDLIEIVAEREANQEKTQKQQHDEAFEASFSKASDLYPDLGNQESEFYKRCTEIDEALLATDDPRYFDANKPFMIAQMAAKELNIAPGSKSRKTQTSPSGSQEATANPNPQQVTSPSPQPPRTERPGQLPAASGASRTAGSPTGAAASLAEQVARIDNPDAFEQLAMQVFSAKR